MEIESVRLDLQPLYSRTQNFKEQRKKKKKPETEREVRDQRPGFRACMRVAWVACETQAVHRT